MKLSAQALYEQAFNRPRDARSLAYKRGVRMALGYRIDRQAMACPFVDGTAESDAWYAGTQEGHSLWREALEQDKAED